MANKSLFPAKVNFFRHFDLLFPGVVEDGPFVVECEFSATSFSGLETAVLVSFWFFISTDLALSPAAVATGPPPDLVSLGIINFLGDADDVDVTEIIKIVIFS